ncbi:hypothetical protein BGX26_003459 [Mortierella sp. AD094]|nr:hypothetical protein BGX26_003459 [Mortierella sp. AD094]
MEKKTDPKQDPRFQVRVSLPERNLEKLLAMGKFRPTLTVQYEDFSTEEALWGQIVKAVIAEQQPLVISGWNNHAAWNGTLFDFDGIRTAFKGEGRNTSPRTGSPFASENLMAYIGGEGTWYLMFGLRRLCMCIDEIEMFTTPGHFDHCGAIGHNLMAWAEEAHPSDYQEVKRTWKQKSGRDFEKEDFFAPLHALKSARSKFFVLEQKVGDFVIIPSMARHQVYNKGNVTVKIAWNRITPDSLETSIKDVLPRYREICHKEAYKMKSVVRATVQKWTTLITKSGGSFWPFGDHDLCKAFGQVLKVYQYIIWEDSLLLAEIPIHSWLDSVELFNVTELAHGAEFKAVEQGRQRPVCNFCGADIWNRFIQCSVSHLADPYVVCNGCFAEGRGCKHRALETMEFFQMFPLEVAVEDYTEGVRT